MMTYEEYVVAMKEADDHRTAVEAAHHRGEPIEYKVIGSEQTISTKTGFCLENNPTWSWDIHYYRVQKPKPLTDQDAAVWPRLKVMVRDYSTSKWAGPFDFLGVDDDEEYLCPNTRWNFARRCTKEEEE